MNESRVSQLHARAVQRLRKMLGRDLNPNQVAAAMTGGGTEAPKTEATGDENGQSASGHDRPPHARAARGETEGGTNRSAGSSCRIGSREPDGRHPGVGTCRREEIGR